MALNIKPREQCRWDAAALGEIMLRLDPGDERDVRGLFRARGAGLFALPVRPVQQVRSPGLPNGRDRGRASQTQLMWAGRARPGEE